VTGVQTCALPIYHGVCGSYPSKTDRTITSGLPTIRPECAGRERQLYV
jgi:hypothetical protein